ncbi:MAG: hypothetical protein ABI704_10105 [Kofleriaceae bacterium]
MLTEVKVWEEQAITVDEFKKLGREEKQGMTLRERDGAMRVYLDKTDVDLMVVEPGPAGKRIRRLAQEKAGAKDTPAAAKSQNEQALHAIEGARSGGKHVRLEAGGVDITKTLDLSTAATADKVSVGPAGKGFDESLEVTASDLERLMKDLVTESKKGGK